MNEISATMKRVIEETQNAFNKATIDGKKWAAEYLAETGNQVIWCPHVPFDMITSFVDEDGKIKMIRVDRQNCGA